MYGEPTTHKPVGWIAPSTKRVLAALLIPAHLPHIFFGVHAPGLGSQGGERASNMHTFPPNTQVVFNYSLFQVQHRLD